MIRVEHLQKAYGSLHVLKDVNTTISKGEVISIIGPSGTGKSTFMRCLNLLDTPTGGKVYIDDKDILDPKTDINKIRQKVGMVFQNFNLFHHLTIIENICLAPMKLLGRSQEEARSKAMELLTMVGLAEKANAYPDQLSGGQKQRIAIARSLLNDPEVIIADEPTGNLDNETADGIMKLLTGINQEKGTAVVMVTHNRQIFEKYPGRVMVCKDEVCTEQMPDEPIDLELTI